MKEFKREYKEDKPVLAICYDFDKTLSPDDMQAQGYIQSVGYDVSTFWKECNQLAEENEMDQNLAYMYKMIQEAEGTLVFKKEELQNYGSKVKLFKGVEDWFERIRTYGESKGVIVEHYIISSGLKEMIEGTTVAKANAFKKIYASSFYFNDRGVAKWPAQVVNYTNKTQFLFRIEKGVLDINDPGVNDYFPPEDLRVPFRNMIYIGDSDTDVPCMKLVNANGGHSIGVYNADTKDKTKVYKMFHDNRIRYFAPADYSENQELDLLVKAIIDRTASNDKLETIYYKNKDEFQIQDKEKSETEKIKSDLIIKLENSENFRTTHYVISKLLQYNNWSHNEKEKLYITALQNSQITNIINDIDVSDFYKKLLSEEKQLSDSANTLKNLLK